MLLYMVKRCILIIRLNPFKFKFSDTLYSGTEKNDY